MRTVDQELQTITDYDPGKGVLLRAKAIKVGAAPVDNVAKWAWDDADYEDVLMFVKTPQSAVPEPVSADAEEIAAIKAELKDLKASLESLTSSIKNLIHTDH